MDFIFKLLKDTEIIAVILLAGFLILYNPLARPKQVVGYGYWSIQKREHRLLLGLTGHTFLELRDDKNRVIEQLHGLATDSNTNKWKEIGNNPEDNLKVWLFDGDKNMTYKNIDIGRTGTNIVAGKESDVREKWSQMISCGTEINKQNIKYPKYGFKIFGETENSNSVAHSLIVCSGLKDIQIGIITPGEGVNLLIEKINEVTN